MRPVWVGAISFGLVNIPVELITVENNTSLDFTLLDKRDNNRTVTKKSTR
jgi:DNA end-binding protein Ku